MREAPAEAQNASHQLLLRAAIARPLAAGLYTLMPLGLRAAKKIEQIIREEMDRIGCQEMELPVLTPAEYWRESGRWDALEPVTFRTKDHGGHEFMISYTHEELVTHHARNEILSYRQLPVMVYHFQSKGRDEARPRAGLLRAREFVMKDAYSLDADSDGLDRSYRAQHEAYARIFRRAGVEAISVESDTGAMGGDVAHEFQVLTEAGEDRLLLCEACDYRANMEKAVRRIPDAAPVDAPAASEIATPGTATIEALTAMTGEPPFAFLKTMLLRGTGGVVAIVLPGDREVNDAKVRKLLGGGDTRFAGGDDFTAARAVPGYIGPVRLRARVVVDTSVEPRPYIAGGNKPDVHLRDVLLGRDFDGERVDVHDVRDGDLCPRCGGRLALRRGVEVGNIFKFGPYYSEKMDATFLAEDGSRRPFYFGSYGIGVGRLMQTIIEINRDGRGIVWPIQVAPFEAHVIVLPQSDQEVRAAAERLVGDLERLGVEVLHDDRDESAGVKFADADLIGLPFRVTVSRRSLGSHAVELKERSGSEAELVDVDAAAERICGAVRRARETARAL